MRGHADLRSGEIERDLDDDNQNDVSEPSPGEGFVAMAQQIARPNANDSEDAARGANEIRRGGIPEPQEQHPRARSETGQQIINTKTHRANDAFEPRTDYKKRVEIEKEVQGPVVKEQGAQHPPIFAGQDGPRLERSQSMQRERVGGAAKPDFGD